jgi:hypothetical protein
MDRDTLGLILGYLGMTFAAVGFFTSTVLFFIDDGKVRRINFFLTYANIAGFIFVLIMMKK